MVKSHDQLKGAFREFLANLRCAQQAVWSNDFLDFSCMMKPMTCTKQKKVGKINQKHSKFKTWKLCFFFGCSGFIWSILSLNFSRSFYVNRRNVKALTTSLRPLSGGSDGLSTSMILRRLKRLKIFSDRPLFWGWKNAGKPWGIPTKDWGNLREA